MKTTTINVNAREPINVLLVGNNPVDLSIIHNLLNNFRGQRYVTETAFDISGFFRRLLKFTPNFILIDDNLGNVAVKNLVNKLSTDTKTRDIPITLLKNSNYEDSSTSGVMDFMLKDNVSGESIYKSLLNSRRLRKAQVSLYKFYKKGVRGQHWL